MKYTLEKFNETFENYNELLELARQFSRDEKEWDRTIRFDEFGNIEQYVNTACHCHPEYEWKQLATVNEFYQWLEKKQKEKE